MTPRPARPTRPASPSGLHWKTRHIVDWAGGRPFIWLDDEIGATDRLWVEAQHGSESEAKAGARALLHRVDPNKGLVDDDFTALSRWLRMVDQRR